MKTRLVLLVLVVLLVLMLVAPLAAQDTDTPELDYRFEKFSTMLGWRGFTKTPWIMGWRRGFSRYMSIW